MRVPHLDQLQKSLIARDHLVFPQPKNIDLAAKYSGLFGVKITPAMISDIVEECMINKWLGVVINNLPDENIEEDRTLAVALKNKYRKRLGHAVVVKVPEAPTSNKSDVAGVYTTPFALYSDRVHFILGKAMGQLMPLWIKDDDKIGLSSGRGVRYSINALDKTILTPKNVQLMSLTGALEMREHALHTVIMDGDLNVAALAAHFQFPVTVHMAACDVAKPGFLPWFLDQSIEMPKKALVGIGVLEGRNRYCRQPKTMTATPVQRDGAMALARDFPKEFEARQEALADVEKELDALEELVRHARSNGHPCVIGELANRLFYVDPPTKPDGKPKEPPRVAEINKKIAELDEKLRCAKLDRLAGVELYVVAGTTQKADAIFTALTGLNLKIGTLVIDNWAAQHLLNR